MCLKLNIIVMFLKILKITNVLIFYGKILESSIKTQGNLNVLYLQLRLSRTC